MPARPRQASPPRPLLPVAFAVAGGVWLGASPLAVLAAAACSLALLLAWAIARRESLRAPALLAGVACAASAWSYACRLPARDDIGTHAEGEYVTLSGVVCGDVFPHSRTIVCQLRVTGAQVHGGGAEAASGRVFAYLPATPGTRVPDYGDCLTVHGRIEAPGAPSNPGGFDSTAYAERSGVARLIRTRTVQDWSFAPGGTAGLDWFAALAARVRGAFVSGLRRVLPSPRSDLVASVVLGSSSGLPDALKDDFVATGTAHILAASGYNVAVVALCGLPLGRRLHLSRRASLWLTLAMVFAYVLIAGAKPSVVRAGIMASLFLLAEILDRHADAANLLAASAIAILVADPSAIRDVGFQLSYAIVAAIVAASPLLGACASRSTHRTRHRPQPVRRLATSAVVCAATTLLAQLAALPLMAQQFNQAPLAGLVANLLILPIVGALTIAGLVLGLLSLGLPALAAMAAPVVGLAATLVLGIARICAELPYASVPTPSPGWPLVLAYFAAFWVALLWARARLASGAGAEWQAW